MTKTIKNKPNSFEDIMKEQMKKEKTYLRKIDKCKTKRCSKYNKKRLLEYKRFFRQQDIECPQKSNADFYNCSAVFYENSKYKQLYDDWVKCSHRKCSKERNDLKRLRQRFA
jgi:hypothetical protein